MKKLVIIIILLISNFSYYGVVNDEGEKVTNMQEIMQSQNVIVEGNVAIEIQENEIKEQVEEKIEVQPTKVEEKQENKTEEPKVIATKKDSTSIEKKETKNTSINTEKEEQKNKKDEKQVEQQLEQSSEEVNKIEKQNDNLVKEQEQKTVIPKCIETNHQNQTGNTGKWFFTKQEAISYYDKEIKYWGDWWVTTNSEEDDEKYRKNCPIGYEIWDCPYCLKWTINFYYNK